MPDELPDTFFTPDFVTAIVSRYGLVIAAVLLVAFAQRIVRSCYAILKKGRRHHG